MEITVHKKDINKILTSYRIEREQAQAFAILMIQTAKNKSVRFTKEQMEKCNFENSSFCNCYEKIGNRTFYFDIERDDNKHMSTYYVNSLEPEDLILWYQYYLGDNFRHWKVCEECNKPYEADSNNQKWCLDHRKRRNDKYSYNCIDCGKPVFKKPGQRKHKRCECCQAKYKTNYWREKKREYRKEVINNG